MRVIPAAFVFLTLHLVLLGGCKQATEDNTPQKKVVTARFAGQSRFNPSWNGWYSCTVHICDLFVTGPDSVMCEVRKPDGTMLPAFGFYNDGGDKEHGGPDFASRTSCDERANDLGYTRQINDSLLAGGMEGNFDFHFTFYGGDAEFRMDNGNHVMETARAAHDCIITSWPQDSIFPECFEPRTLTVHVQPYPGATVTSVSAGVSFDYPHIWRISGGDAELAPMTGGSVWQCTLTIRKFRCVPTIPDSTYTSGRMVYSARTSSGGSCNVEVPIASFVNNRPSLSNPVVPDTVMRDTSYALYVPLSVTLHDCEIVGDTAFGLPGHGPMGGVKFDWHADTLPWNLANDYDHILSDNGQPPDGVAGDGTFSGYLPLITLDDSTASDTLYNLRFYAMDCAWPFDTSAYVYDSVRVIRL